MIKTNQWNQLMMRVAAERDAARASTNAIADAAQAKATVEAFQKAIDAMQARRALLKITHGIDRGHELDDLICALMGDMVAMKVRAEDWDRDAGKANIEAASTLGHRIAQTTEQADGMKALVEED